MSSRARVEPLILSASRLNKKLKKTVARTGVPGKWRELKCGHKQFRSDRGGYLNWWETTKTVIFQGHNFAAREELTEAFIAVASAKKRLLGGISRSRVLWTNAKPLPRIAMPVIGWLGDELLERLLVDEARRRSGKVSRRDNSRLL
jgi:hypothetical protein